MVVVENSCGGGCGGRDSLVVGVVTVLVVV